MCEFDAGAKGSSVADHVSKSGVSHNYVAFANTGDGDGLTHHANGALNVTASVVVGPPTPYAPGKPFANIEYDVSHTSTPLQAIAGGGTSEALSPRLATALNHTGRLYRYGVISSAVLDPGRSSGPQETMHIKWVYAKCRSKDRGWSVLQEY